MKIRTEMSPSSGKCGFFRSVGPARTPHASRFISILEKPKVPQLSNKSVAFYRGADKSLARPTPLCILFDGENISFDASLLIHIYKYY